MTANQGPGVPAELRARLARHVFNRRHGPYRSFGAAYPSVRAAFEREADEILAAISASGHVIVRADTVCLQPATDEVVLSGFNPDDYPVEPGAGR